MKTSHVLGAFVLSALGCMLVACETVEPNAKVAAFTDARNPDETAQPQAAYPEGPYGLAIGSVVPNLKFYGWHNPQVSADPNHLEEIDFAQFYNPTGQDTWPADGSYRPGEPKPKVLWVDISAQWCSACQAESKTELKSLYAKYQPMGAELLLELIEDQDGGPAKPANLLMWTNAYKTAWPAIVDPTRQMFTLAVPGSYPGNLLIDTRTMKLIARVGDAPPPNDPFFTTLEANLN
jgi:hypothetical protein